MSENLPHSNPKVEPELLQNPGTSNYKNQTKIPSKIQLLHSKSGKKIRYRIRFQVTVHQITSSYTSETPEPPRKSEIRDLDS